jgi:hypothetical protein
MKKLYNISEWNELPWLNTGGTRNKKIYQSPDDNELYYFKQSLKKEKKDYKYEFWSEIIAYELGKMCGFNVLPYHIAIRGNEVGCISKSMINPNKEELVEGGRYIQAFDNTFNAEDRSLRHQYTFELVTASLAFIGLQKYNRDFIEMLVFDALIGNSDRHQENWAIINQTSGISNSLRVVEFVLSNEKHFHDLPNWLKKLVKSVFTKDGKLKVEFKRARLSLPSKTRFSPIYDSGCSFGRELQDDKIFEMLKDPKAIEKYVKKGESEIHWQGKKVSHFVLLANLLGKEAFKSMVQHAINGVANRFDQERVFELISKIDVDLPPECEYIKIPSERKELICKLALSRFNSLKALVEEKIK